MKYIVRVWTDEVGVCYFEFDHMEDAKVYADSQERMAIYSGCEYNISIYEKKGE